MHRTTSFSYRCHQCGLCCIGKVITLSPYDVLRMARAAALTTGETVRRYTLRRGSLLRFGERGCAALDGTRCGVHSGRPLACRLYPLGLERGFDGERFVRLEPARGSIGEYGTSGTIADFLTQEGVLAHLAVQELYCPLISAMAARAAALADFVEQTEPREFWRRATREALRESGFDPNPLIDTMFDPDGAGCRRASEAATVTAHIECLRALAEVEKSAPILAESAVLLSVSLGYGADPAAAASEPLR